VRIGIDIHTLGERQTGNETYMRQLVEHLTALPEPSVDYLLYHTRQSPAPEWAARAHRVWPHTPAVRIPVSFPIVLRRDRVHAAHFQYVTPPWCPCPTVVSVHDISYESHPEFFPARTRARMRALVPRAVRSAAAVLTISEFSRRDIAERYRIDPARIVVTPLAAAPVFRPLPAAETESRLDRLGITGPYVLAVGNVQPRKNLVRLLEAFALARQRMDLPHRLVLVGRRAYRGDAILARQDALGLSAHVVTTGFVGDDDLVALYNGADVFAYPSLYEGFGLPILEAMECGAPVITSATTALPEVAGDAAELVDPCSVDDIAAALGRLLTSPGWRETLRARGMLRASEFSWRRVAEETLAVYKQAA